MCLFLWVSRGIWFIQNTDKEKQKSDCLYECVVESFTQSIQSRVHIHIKNEKGGCNYKWDIESFMHTIHLKKTMIHLGTKQVNVF